MLLKSNLIIFPACGSILIKCRSLWAQLSVYKYGHECCGVGSGHAMLRCPVHSGRGLLGVAAGRGVAVPGRVARGWGVREGLVSSRAGWGGGRRHQLSGPGRCVAGACAEGGSGEEGGRVPRRTWGRGEPSVERGLQPLAASPEGTGRRRTASGVGPLPAQRAQCSGLASRLPAQPRCAPAPPTAPPPQRLDRTGSRINFR